MTATQAQDLQAALWAIGLRVPGAGLADVRAALEDGSVVRSWPMRGTLHLVAPEDLRWMLDLTAERLTRVIAGRHGNWTSPGLTSKSAATWPWSG